MKKQCAICDKKIGFFTLSLEAELKTGERVCSSCFESLGISMEQFTTAGFKDDIKRLPFDVVKQAFDGDEAKKNQILKLANRATERAEENASAKEEERKVNALIKENQRKAKEDERKAQNEQYVAKMEAKKAEIIARREHKEEGLVYEFDGGAGDVLLVYEDRVTIRRKGVMNLVLMGIQGDKTIYFSDITSVQYKESGLAAGYIQFTLPGGTSQRGGMLDAVQDENTVTFKENDEMAEEIVNYLNGALRKIKSPNTTPQTATIVNQVSVADELMKFKGLLDAGVLTQEEFDKKKSELLNL